MQKEIITLNLKTLDSIINTVYTTSRITPHSGRLHHNAYRLLDAGISSNNSINGLIKATETFLPVHFVDQNGQCYTIKMW
jgi:hypothetical protein